VDSKQLEEIIALETALHQPNVRHDSEHLQQVMCDGFKEYARSGRCYDKASLMASSLSEPEIDGEILAWGFEAKALAPDVAMLNYRSAFRDGLGITSHFAWRSSIWKKCEAGAWKMQFHQGTPTSAEYVGA
jgi:hypothetical protein